MTEGQVCAASMLGAGFSGVGEVPESPRVEEEGWGCKRPGTAVPPAWEEKENDPQVSR